MPLLERPSSRMATSPELRNQAFIHHPIATLSDGRTYGPQIRRFLRHGDGSATTPSTGRGPWPTRRLRSGMRSSRRTGGRNTGSTIAAWASDHDGVFARITISFSDTSKARRFGGHELVDTRRCFSDVQRFRSEGSFRDLPTSRSAERRIEPRH